MTRRIALITGGTRGIGRAISLRLAQDGLVPVMVYRADQSAAQETLEAVQQHAPDARIERTDVGDPDQVADLVARLKTDPGQVDVLVHSAFRSGRPAKKTHELDVKAWTDDLATNLTGPFLMARACLPMMIERQHGRIVFIGSLAMRGERGRVAYTVAKNGVVGLARTLAQEYARSGITANVVSPGYIEAGAFMNLDEKIRELAQRQVPGRRLGTGEEVAAAVAYLCREDAGFTTGQVLSVDGGTR